MPRTITCPRCTHANAVDEASTDKPVHCRVCHHLLKTAAPDDVPVLELTPEHVKAGPPQPAARSSAEPPPARKSRPVRTDDEEDDRPRRRPRKPEASGGGGSAVVVALLAGAGALVVLGCCGVSGVAYFFVGDRGEPVPPIAVFDPPKPGPPVVPGPPPVAPPLVAPPVRLNPNNPNDLNRALVMLRQGGAEFSEACRWFRQANVNVPQRAEVSRALEARLDDQKRDRFGNADFFEAYFRWATQDNVPSLVQMVQDGDFSRIQRRHQAIAALGRLKDARGAEPLMQRLSEIHDRWNAARALEDMGSAAQPVLAKHVNDANREVRQTARDILKKQNAGRDVLLPQTLQDLNAGDEQVRAAALEMLGQIPASDKQRPEVARTLDRLINPNSLKGPLLKALDVWGTAENAQTIANNLNPADFFSFREQLRLLVRFKDARTVPALISHFNGPGLAGIETRNALKAFGPTAEPEVVKLLMSPDMRVRHDACRLLGDIGTLNVTGPALQKAAAANPNDRLLPLLGRTTLQRIQQRGG